MSPVRGAGERRWIHPLDGILISAITFVFVNSGNSAVQVGVSFYIDDINSINSVDMVGRGRENERPAARTASFAYFASLTILTGVSRRLLHD